MNDSVRLSPRSSHLAELAALLELRGPLLEVHGGGGEEGGGILQAVLGLG